jgi:RimJ/RimL family protein N-acetyltransferase
MPSDLLCMPARACGSVSGRTGPGASSSASYDRVVATVETDRLVVRSAREIDRSRFIELFTDETFMVFSAGVHDVDSASSRFDHMIDFASTVPYAKQPIIERATGIIIGYTGVDSVAIDGLERLEWGWRITADTRGQGYAVEATNALLAVADPHDDGEMLCIIASDNEPSMRVADKVGFRRWRHVVWPDGVPTDLLVRSIGAGGPPLLAPG